MTTDADLTRLTVVPAQPPENGGDRMNGFEVAVNFILDDLPRWFFAVISVVSVTAGAVEMFLELDLVWSVLVMAGLIGAGISAGTRLKRLPLVSVFLPSRTASRPVKESQ